MLFRFQLKWEIYQGVEDDTALDMIKMICNDGTIIYGIPERTDLFYGKIYDGFGEWGQLFSCPSGQYYDAAEFR